MKPSETAGESSGHHPGAIPSGGPGGYPGTAAMPAQAVPSQSGRPIALVAVAAGAFLLIATAVVVVVVSRPDNRGPDPFAGAYPLVSAAPVEGESGTAAPTWRPAGQPAGPLRRFAGTPTKVIGRLVDRKAGLSYARLARPYGKIGLGVHTGGQEFKSRGNSLRTFWYCAVYSRTLDPELMPAVRAAGRSNAMRAAAELTATKALKLFSDAKRTDFAGQPLTISGRRAWLTGVRTNDPPASRRAHEWTKVFVAVDTGRALPGIAEIHIPNVQQRRLSDINTIVKSLSVAR